MGGEKRLRKTTMMRDFRGLQDYDIYSTREKETKNKRGTREREKIYEEILLIYCIDLSFTA
jgi:hypothetical protein